MEELKNASGNETTEDSESKAETKTESRKKIAEKAKTEKSAAVISLEKSELEKMVEELVSKRMAEAGEKPSGSDGQSESQEEEKRRKYYEEKVVVNLFFDGGKYKDDVMVSVNGKLWQIKRGVDVEVPRYVSEILKSSMEQDRKTALHIRDLETKYEESLK